MSYVPNITDEQLNGRGSYDAWLDSPGVVRGRHIACPVRFLWNSYVDHCVWWGFEVTRRDWFVYWLKRERGVEFRMCGSGRLRRVALGIGITTGDR